MLDVIHFFFEEDSRFSSAEEAEAVSALRTSVYRDLYGTFYQYGAPKSKNNQVAAGSYSDFLDETKPYIPPTDFNPERANPFGDLLDSPIG